MMMTVIMIIFMKPKKTTKRTLLYTLIKLCIEINILLFLKSLFFILLNSKFYTLIIKPESKLYLQRIWKLNNGLIFIEVSKAFES